MNLDDFIYKTNLPELTAYFEQFGKEFYIDADEINSIVDRLKLLSNNVTSSGFIERKAHGFVGQNYIIDAFFKWAIDNSLYSNLESISLAVPYSASGKTRFERIAATTENTFIRIVGEESTSAAALPDLLDNTIELTRYIVRDNAIDTPMPVEPTGNFVEKAYYSTQTYNGSTEINTLGLSEKRGGVIITGSVPKLGGFQRNSNNFVLGSPFFVHNRTTGVLELVNRNGSSNLQMIFPDEENLFLRKDHVAFFVEVVIDGVNYKKFVASSSYMPKASQTQSGGVKTTANEADPLVYTYQEVDALIEYAENNLQAQINKKLTIYNNINSNTTAPLNSHLNVIGNCSITSPTPIDGKGYYQVHVVNGIAIIDGVAYGAGSLVLKTWYDGEWKVDVYENNTYDKGVYETTGVFSNIQLLVDNNPSGTAIHLKPNAIYEQDNSLILKEGITVNGNGATLKRNPEQVTTTSISVNENSTFIEVASVPNEWKSGDYLQLYSGETRADSSYKYEVIIQSITGNTITLTKPIGRPATGMTRTWDVGTKCRKVFSQITSQRDYDLFTDITAWEVEGLTLDGNQIENSSSFYWGVNMAVQNNGRAKLNNIIFKNMPNECVFGTGFSIKNSFAQDLNGSFVHFSGDINFDEKAFGGEINGNTTIDTNLKSSSAITGHSEGLFTFSFSSGRSKIHSNRFINGGESILGRVSSAVALEDGSLQDFIFTDNYCEGFASIVNSFEYSATGLTNNVENVILTNNTFKNCGINNFGAFISQINNFGEIKIYDNILSGNTTIANPPSKLFFNVNSVEDLEIGVANLLDNSHFDLENVFNGFSDIYGTQIIEDSMYKKVFTETSSSARVDKTFLLEETGTFTYSIYAQSSKNLFWDNFSGLTLVLKTEVAEAGFKVYTITFKNETPGYKIIRLYVEGQENGDFVNIEWEKLERGNKSTGYFQKLGEYRLGTEGTGDRIALFNSDNKLVGYEYISKTLVRDAQTITNTATPTDAFLKTIAANTIGEKDVINGTFIFNCLVATTKVDYKVVFAGIDVAVFSQVGYQAVNESTEISIKIFRDANKLKISSSLIGGTAVVYSFYYETTPFDFLESNDLKVTMEATNANEVSVQFAELILSK